MTEWSSVWLAVMAISLAVMAVIQIGLIIVGLRVAQRATVAIEDLRKELGPLTDKLNRIADEASRAASLAALQVERVDQLMSTATVRVDQTLGLLQNVVSGPVRQGVTAINAFRAALSIFRGWQGRKAAKRAAPVISDEDDQLFVG